MKVKDLLKMLEAYKPEDNLCVLYWDKEQYDYPDSDELELSEQSWVEVCNEFDTWDDAGADITEWLHDAVIEKAEPTQ